MLSRFATEDLKVEAEDLKKEEQDLLDREEKAEHQLQQAQEVFCIHAGFVIFILSNSLSRKFDKRKLLSRIINLSLEKSSCWKRTHSRD